MCVEKREKVKNEGKKCEKKLRVGRKDKKKPRTNEEDVGKLRQKNSTRSPCQVALPCHIRSKPKQHITI